MRLLQGILSLDSIGKLREIVETSTNEREFCELLANHLGARANTVINGVEADLSIDTEACEVKLYPSRFYSGFGQALALVHIAGFKDVCVFHVVKTISEEYMENLRKLCTATNLKACVYSEVSGLHVINM
ncbi:MAG: hypothetical protein QXX32_03650 [Thermofilum sp.]|uniref:Uncharacterized protein n=1 Tax=Thermofilum adornatum 1505 TaxID=697581 RepID=A0A3G1A9X5_9CREN|nr:hypothetical protein [Thermofilum adornatum]AJB42611.1 hypothetical protein TCARB_1569 [Thermofilum adornatum 1505]